MARTVAEKLDASVLKALAASSGLSACAVANLTEILACLDRAAWLPRPRAGTEALLKALLPVLPRALAGAFLACALPYPAEAGGAGEGAPAATVAAFARADYYRTAVRALQRLARLVRERTGLPKNALRVFVNSRIPEKPIAAAAGLGHYGRNRLLYHDRLGSRIVIGLLFLPFRLAGPGDERDPASPDDFCGKCAACLSACPVAALGPDEPASLPRCLKTRSDALEFWDEATRRAWGRRFYGCDACQDVCPKNGSLPFAAPAKDGALGRGIDIAHFLLLNEDECRRRFRGTALGLKWILPELLMRNALCSAGNSGRAELLPAVQRHLKNPRPVLADMASWAEKRLFQDGGRG